MTYQVLGEDGHAMDAHVEVDPTGVTLHSRGGSSARGTVKNADYGPALRLLLRRIASTRLPFDSARVDSSEVQGIPIEERTILRSGELDFDGSSAFTLMSNRMKLVGQVNGRKGGNSTKRVRIQFARDIDALGLEEALRIIWIDKDLRSAERLPAELLGKVTAEYIWNAVDKLRDPLLKHAYGPSTDFDLVTDAGERFPPKAVFGIAATEALGFEVLPKHFSGGKGTICFRVLERAGFTIVPKYQYVQPLDVPVSSEDRQWTEGKPRLITHLRKERASGLAEAKKDWFIRTYGHLKCEKCGMDPIEAYGGSHGTACIEVHHQAVQVENMAETHRTKLEDLQCLCANCHRVEHRLLNQKSDEIFSSPPAV
jgi:5-methylcytosine-specific restriction protein A